MASWQEFAQSDPELAAWGRERFEKFRVAFLATIRKNGAPRVHPVTPIIGEEHLFLFMEPTSPKGHDLKRDGRYALHSLIRDSEGTDGEFFIHGTAEYTESPEDRQAAAEASSYKPSERYILFKFYMSAAFSNEYADDGTPIRHSWKDTN